MSLIETCNIIYNSEGSGKKNVSMEEVTAGYLSRLMSLKVETEPRLPSQSTLPSLCRCISTYIVKAKCSDLKEINIKSDVVESLDATVFFAVVGLLHCAAQFPSTVDLLQVLETWLQHVLKVRKMKRTGYLLKLLCTTQQLANMMSTTLMQKKAKSMFKFLCLTVFT